MTWLTTAQEIAEDLLNALVEISDTQISEFVMRVEDNRSRLVKIRRYPEEISQYHIAIARAGVYIE